jgi:glycosyltransferase involved in cell wall biosynthesis
LDMRVVILAYEWPPVTGGAGRALQGMIRGTAVLREEYDVDVTVVASAADHRTTHLPLGPRADLWLLGVHKTMNRRRCWWSMLLWPWKIPTLKADVYHVWQALPNVWLAHRPFLLTLHGSDVPGRNPAYNWKFLLAGRSYRRQWHRAAALTAVTPRLAELAEKFGGRPVQVVPNGVNLPLLPKRELHRPLRILMVTRIEPLKNVHLGVQVAGLMQNEAVLRIVGDGPDRVLYQDCGLRNLEFTGWCEDPDEHYRWADVFLNCAEATGLSCAVLEARSWGLPIISRYVPGIVSEGGILTAAPNAPALVDVIHRVTANYEESVARANQHREEVAWGVRGRPYFELYRSIANAK